MTPLPTCFAAFAYIYGVNVGSRVLVVMYHVDCTLCLYTSIGSYILLIFATVIHLGHCICTFNISARVLRLFHGKVFGLVWGIKLNHNYMSCQQVVTVTSCLVYKVVRDF